jgi:spore maturation protein CgeD
MDPKVSVILTSYNKPEYLDIAIQSVLSQTYSNYELIIADDNSPNISVFEVISKYQNHKNVRFFKSDVTDDNRLKTTRYATQINRAVVELSTGKYICYLADDDHYYPLMLEKMVESAAKYNYDVCFCAQHIKDSNGNIDGAGDPSRGRRFFSEPLKRGADKLDHNQVMTSRTAFNKVGGWDDSPGWWGGADAAFYDRLENAGYTFYPIDYHEPLQAKVYREKSVQWNIANNLRPDNK